MYVGPLRRAHSRIHVSTSALTHTSPQVHSCTRLHTHSHTFLHKCTDAHTSSQVHGRTSPSVMLASHSTSPRSFRFDPYPTTAFILSIIKVVSLHINDYIL